ncbi:MAG: DUF697 domain-containing protein [Comamonas sp.]|nr:DUF697 domain-containing protein [Comamonas sp.]
MHRTTHRILMALLVAFLAYVAVFTVAMVSQLADAADRVHAGAGQWTFWGLLAVLAVAVVVPTALLLRLPAALQPPSSDDPTVQAAYQTRLRQHLARNAHLAGQSLQAETDVAQALQQLQTLADAETRRTAASVLASTALLQNGRLDGLVVLASQLRLVWRVARIYGLRPSLRQMGYLYGNVGACMLLANSLDEMDFAELAAPLVQATTPAALASVPGLGAMGSLLTNSLASGAANAFLTLRVGLMAQAYCAPLQRPERAAVRRSATVRAAGQLGQLVREAGSSVSQAVYGRMRDAVSQTAQSTVDSVRQSGQTMVDATRDAARSAASTSGAWVDQATGKLHKATLQVADHTARAADAVQHSTQQATQQTRDKLHAAIVALKKKP